MQRHKLLFLAWNWPMLESEAWLKTNKQRNNPVDNIVRHVACFVLGTWQQSGAEQGIPQSMSCTCQMACQLSDVAGAGEVVAKGEAKLSKLALSVKDCAIRLMEKKKEKKRGENNWINTSGTQARQ